ncbi:TIR domain-containing protein [Candidatus Methanophagaceae archaeon]|jgi:hypothetical protein|nr:TIR domain-containing protein [Methanophagales archaeon]
MEENIKNHKVFIIHASEDKERFVLDFATKLRSKGIDAWVDKWEIHPGNILIDKIFEEGIKNAQAVIIVLSKYSVVKPWVREELNISVVRRIQKKIKLIIPVVIDDCQVPVCLQSTVWVKIKNLENYEAELKEIIMSIYGQRDRPSLGKPPRYTQTEIDVLPNLTKVDSLVLKLSCEKAINLSREKAIENGSVYYDIDTNTILEQILDFDISQEEFYESLEILNKREYLEGPRAFNATNRRAEIINYRITFYGFDEYLRAYIMDYDSILKSVASQIVNLNGEGISSIYKSVDQPQIIVDHFLEVLESRGDIKSIKFINGRVSIFEISPELKRKLR